MAEITVSAPLLKRYKQTLAAFVDGAREFCTRRGMTYLLANNQTAGRAARVAATCASGGWCADDPTINMLSLVAVGRAGGGAAGDRAAVLSQAHAAQPLEVPSTYLWHKSIEDLHVNSIWQRLRQSLLLFLQLLLVALAILALLRPGWQRQQADRRPVHLPDRQLGQHERDRRRSPRGWTKPSGAPAS